MRNNALRLWLLAALLCCVQSLAAQSNSSLEKEFLNPSGDNKPWTLWYWMYGAVTEEALTADLEAMQGAGLGGAHLVTIRSSENPRGVQFEGQADQLTENWWKMVRHTIRECDRLGLQLAVHIADGFALAGGPWISPEESMQKVVFAETAVEGGEVHLTLAKPAHYPDYYRDIALYAIPERYAPIEVKPRVSCETLAPNATEKQRANIDEKGVIRAGARCRIDLTYDEVVEVRNVEIILSGNNYQAHRLKIYASENGTDFRYVTQLEPARHGWQNNDSQSTHAIVPTRGKVFRFEWDPEGSEPGAEDLDAAKWKANLKIKEILLGSEPRLHQWEGKSGQVWRVARETTDAEIPAADCLQADDMIDLTAALNGDELRCTLPAGQWRLVRLGHTSTGHTNATGGAGIGLECDKFSRAAVSEQIEGWFGAIYRSVDEELAKRVIKLLYVDSWECGSQNWSANFAAEFKARRGYDLKPYLLLYAGIPVESAARSEEVMRDIRTTIAELIHDVFFTVLAEKADQYGCRFTAESVAPTMISDGMYHYDKVDIPMGEFWLNSPTHDKPNDMLDAISGGHVYGKQVIAAEGFTTLRGVWNESPATLKPLLDYNYALGLNRLAYHVYTHNPWLNRKPGMTLDGIGLFYQRDNTWWEHGAKGMNDYVARCQALLQWGRPVVDIAVFTGEEMPRRSILPDRLVPSLPGLFGKERVESERLRLENKGVPTRVKPVGVTHSANMADPEDWVNPLRGYAYDAFNRDALLRLGEVKEGRLTTPGEWGGSYKVFVVLDAHPMNPENRMSDAVKAKIEALKKGGVIVPEIPYTPEDFAAYGLERDAVLPENIAWCHRQKGDENTDIYFLANQSAEKRSFTASLRVAGRVPELWNPLTGEIADAAAWRVVEGRTEVDLTLEGYGSIFVVLRRVGAPAEVKAMKQRVTPLKTTSDWWLTFELEDEGVRTERAKELFDWSTFSEDRIRYFSGTVIYRTTFSYKGKGERVVLRLGELHDVAAVKVNGKPCGIVWTSPYEVDITEAVKRGENQLIVEVQNTWANALLGADTGKAPYRRIWTNATYRRAEKDLLPAGLIGPLELVEMKN